ncbi:hypothetical protein N7490_003200 [Penicillium lividum]|nr:hypothetical protein N7490_003200 [Penicillium lividum]
MSGLIIPGQINDLFEVTTDLIEEYDSIKDLRGLPEAFQEVNKQLSLVEQTLRNVKTPAKKLKSASDTLALGTLLDNCDQRAENLREIFRSIAKKSNGQYDPSVYRATLMKQGKRRVETLMDGMLEDLGIFLAHPMFPAEIHEQVGPFAKAREELIKVSASLHDSDLDEQPGTVSQYGDNNRQYNLSGEGRQNIVDGHYFEAKGDQNFGTIPPVQSTKSQID